MTILRWIAILGGILLCCFWTHMGIVVFMHQHYLAVPLYALLVWHILSDVIDNIKALSINNGSSHEESE